MEKELSIYSPEELYNTLRRALSELHVGNKLRFYSCSDEDEDYMTVDDFLNLVLPPFEISFEGPGILKDIIKDRALTTYDTIIEFLNSPSYRVDKDLILNTVTIDYRDIETNIFKHYDGTTSISVKGYTFILYDSIKNWYYWEGPNILLNKINEFLEEEVDEEEDDD